MKYAYCFAAALFMAGSAVASQGNTGRLHGAWEDLNKAEGGILSAQQFASLNNLAFQAAVVRVCEGQALDQERFALGMDHLLVDAEKTLSAPLFEQKKAAVLVAFGARFGLFLAEANQDKKIFCTAGAQLKNTDNEAPVFIK